MDVVALARELAARMAPDALLDADDAGAILGVTGRYLREQLAAAPGFPRAVRLPLAGGGRAHPRWRRSDIMRWVDDNADGRSTRGGRRRKADPLAWRDA